MQWKQKKLMMMLLQQESMLRSKKRGATLEMLAAAVVKTAEAIKEIDSTEQEAEVSQKAAKLSSIMRRISLSKKQKKVTVEG